MSYRAAKSLEGIRKTGWLGWIGLCAVVVAYAFAVVHLHPINFFGFSQDDTLYFSSAKAIAQKHGYILPSVPGTPPATKYPILYPWILSWVWRWDSLFPANLASAVALNLLFGAAYLTAAFTFLRKLPRFNDVVALVLVAFCALNPRVLFFSANLMSDLPFAAVALSACVLTARAIKNSARPIAIVWCGTLAGTSILLRAMGLPIAAGLLLAVHLRHGWRKSMVFSVAVLPFVVVFFLQSLFLIAVPPNASNTCARAWQTTWLYYTSYSGFWRADVLAHGVFWQTVSSNLTSLLLQPGMFFVKLAFIRPAVLGMILTVVLSVLVIRGLFSLASHKGLQPIYWALGFSILPILIWDYAVADRFLIPFLPLFLAAIWTEIGQIAYQFGQRPHTGRGAERNIAAGLLYLASAVLLFGIGISWSAEVNAISRASELRAKALVQKRAAYAWLEHKTAPTARVIAYEDASLFLYSGRQSLRPVILSPSGVYRPEILNSEIECMISSAKPVGANYWLISDDDFDAEWQPAVSRGKEMEKKMELFLNPVYRSEQGQVRIYQLDGLASF